jgi:hypothetical protein
MRTTNNANDNPKRATKQQQVMPRTQSTPLESLESQSPLNTHVNAVPANRPVDGHHRTRPSATCPVNNHQHIREIERCTVCAMNPTRAPTHTGAARLPVRPSPDAATMRRVSVPQNARNVSGGGDPASGDDAGWADAALAMPGEGGSSIGVGVRRSLNCLTALSIALLTAPLTAFDSAVSTMTALSLGSS